MAAPVNKPFLPSEILKVVGEMLQPDELTDAAKVNKLFHTYLNDNMLWFKVSQNLHLVGDNKYTPKTDYKAAVFLYYTDANHIMTEFVKQHQGMRDFGGPSGAEALARDPSVSRGDLVMDHLSLRRFLRREFYLADLIKRLTNDQNHQILFNILVQDFIDGEKEAGRSPLKTAIEVGMDLKVLQLIIERGITNKDSEAYSKALDKPRILEFLIKQKIPSPREILMDALKGGSEESVRVLVEHGVQVTQECIDFARNSRPGVLVLLESFKK